MVNCMALHTALIFLLLLHEKVKTIVSVDLPGICCAHISIWHVDDLY